MTEVKMGTSDGYAVTSVYLINDYPIYFTQAGTYLRKHWLDSDHY